MFCMQHTGPYTEPKQRSSRARQKAQPPHQKTAGGGSFMEGTIGPLSQWP